MEYQATQATVNPAMKAGEAKVTIHLIDYGQVEIHNNRISEPELIREYLWLMEGYSPADGLPEVYAALHLIDRHGGRMLAMEYGNGS